MVVVIDEIGVVYDSGVVTRTPPITMEVVPVKVLRTYEHPPVVGAIIAAERN
jgi:hypothetical protein